MHMPSSAILSWAISVNMVVYRAPYGCCKSLEPATICLAFSPISMPMYERVCCGYLITALGGNNFLFDYGAAFGNSLVWNVQV